MSPGVVTKAPAGSDNMSPNNNKDIYIDRYIDSDNEKTGGKKERHKYGEYKNVLLTDEELEKLQHDFADWQDRIERLSEYIASTGKSYKSHYATIRSWANRDKKTAAQRQYRGQQLPQGTRMGPNGVLINETQPDDALPWAE